jgi:hypothetical protein
LFVVALLLQAVASHPSAPLLPAIGETPPYWRSLQPVSFAKRERVLCRTIGEVNAEFEYRDGAVRVVDINGLSHRLSAIERSTIDRALGGLGWLDRVSIGCNLDHDVLITVAGRPYAEQGRSMTRKLSIVWAQDKMTGVGSKPLPEQEVGPDLYAPH